MGAVLGLADYLVIIAMLAISLGVGIYYRLTGGRQKTGEEYFSANRSMSIFPVSMALMVSFMSAISLLGVSAEIYTYGTQFVIINISYLLGTPIACYCFLPVFFNLKATSVYEYLEKRFGMGTRLTASFLYWIQLLLYSGIVLYAPALALEATTGLSQVASIITIGLVCAFYSSVGGIKAVLITDVFQGFLMFLVTCVIIGTAAYNVHGFKEIWKIAEEGGRIEFDNFSLYPTVRHTYWGLIVGGLCTFLSLYGVHQVQVQRLLTVRSLKAARLALWINWPILMAFSLTICFSGLAIYSKYYKCDPLKEGRISSADMLMPLYIMDTFSHLPGVPGLFIAGIFSAGLSTISAALNSLAAVTLEDYIKPIYKNSYNREISPKKYVLLGKLLAFSLGLACIILAFLAQFLGGILQASLTIFGIVGGPLLGLFTLGMLSKSATQVGAIIGVLTSMIFCLWIAFGQPRPTPLKLGLNNDCYFNNSYTSFSEQFNNTSVNSTFYSQDDKSYFYLYRISYMWYSPLGFALTFIVGQLVSNLAILISRAEKRELDPNLFFPFVAKRMRRKLQKRGKTYMVNEANVNV